MVWEYGVATKGEVGFVIKVRSNSSYSYDEKMGTRVHKMSKRKQVRYGGIKGERGLQKIANVESKWMADLAGLGNLISC